MILADAGAQTRLSNICLWMTGATRVDHVEIGVLSRPFTPICA